VKERISEAEGKEKMKHTKLNIHRKRQKLNRASMHKRITSKSLTYI